MGAKRAHLINKRCTHGLKFILDLLAGFIVGGVVSHAIYGLTHWRIYVMTYRALVGYEGRKLDCPGEEQILGLLTGALLRALLAESI